MLINNKIISDDLFLNLIGSDGMPVYLAVYEENSNQLNLHTNTSKNNRSLKKRAENILSDQGLDVRCVVKTHKLPKLFNRTNLEQFLQDFSNGIIVYDPTAGFTRARILVECARQLRGELGNKLSGVYIEPTSRDFYVVLDIEKFRKNNEIEPELLAETENQIIESINHALHNTGNSFKPSIKIGFQLPYRKLVPVDAESSKYGQTNTKFPLQFRSRTLSTTLAALIGMGIASSVSADGPAVSGPNAKISVSGGETDGSTTFLADGSYAWPVSSSLGAQVDAIGGRISDDTLWGAGGQFFWRDPDKGLLGLNAAYAEFEDINLTQVGVKGELYTGSITTILDGGYQFGGNVKKGGTGGLEVRWYPTDNFYVSAGGSITAGDALGGLGMEYMPGFSTLPGLSLFADGAYGENDFDQVLVGLRYYFGSSKGKSLIRIHREDDPRSLFTGIGGITQALNIQNTRLQRIRNANSYGGSG